MMMGIFLYRRRNLALILALIMGSIGGVAAAVAQPQSPPQSPSQSEQPSAYSPRHMMADQLVLLMDQALAGQGKPTANQLTRAQTLLSMALDLAPADADLWRMQMELARMRNDEKLRHDALLHYVKLNPADDAAQLELILSRVNQEQTVDKRLAIVEHVLDAPSAKALSKPLRSRLASYAASAAQELDKPKAMATRLTQALELDPANADAARMTYQLALKRADNPLLLGMAAVGWVRAQPADPQARFALAKVLLAQGAFEQAAEQFSMSSTLTQGPASIDQARLWATSLAMQGQTQQALTLLDQAQQSLNPKPGKSTSANGAPDKPASADGASAKTAQENAKSPQAAAPHKNADATASLPPALQMVRVAILSSLHRDKPTHEAFEQLHQSLTRIIQAGGNGAKGAARDLAIATALFGPKPEQAAKVLQAGPSSAPTANPPSQTLRLVRGWAALRAGQTKQARQQLEPLAQTNDLAALGMARLESDPAARASLLDAGRQRDPMGMAGLLAVLELGPAKTAPTTAGASLQQYLTRWPSRIWYNDPMRSPWLALRLSVEPGRVGYLEPLRGEATLQNLSGVPLGVGPAGAIPDRMLVSVSLTSGGQAMGPLPPMVIDLGRRLTLPVAGKMTVDFRVDRFALGSILAEHPDRPLSMRITAIIDPRTTGTGNIQPGPLGSLDIARAIQFRSIPNTAQNLNAWIKDLGNDDLARQFEAAARLLRALADKQAADVNAAMRTKIGQALARQYSNFDALGQAWTMRFLPPAEQTPEALRQSIALAQRSDDPLVRVVYLAADVTDPQSPAMTAALRSSNKTIREFAQAQRAGLEIQAQAKSKVKPESTAAGRPAGGQ